MPTNKDLSLKKLVQFPQAVVNQFTRVVDEHNVEDLDIIGGIFEGARYGWLGAGSYFQVICLRTGEKIAAAQFASSIRNQITCVTCACEITTAAGGDGALLAVGMQVGNSGGRICIFSIQGSRTLRFIDVDNSVTCISVVDTGGTLGGPLAAMDSVLAIGSDNGNILFLDICRQACLDALSQGLNFIHEDNWYNCHNVTTSKLNILETEREIAESNGKHLALVVQGLNRTGNDQYAVTCLCPISSISALAIGNSAGHLLLLDLFTFRFLHKSNAPHECGAIECLAFQEPSDDPKAVCFIWAIYRNPHGPMGVLFALSFQQKEPTGIHTYHYQDFQSCSARFSLILGQPGDEPLSCYSTQKSHFQDESEEGVLSICLLTWFGGNGSGLCIFDLNQWYKSEMPSTAQTFAKNSFLTTFPILSGNRTEIIDVRLDPLAVKLFNSLQRVEDHFFTDSLSFDCIVITKMEAARLQWPGLQVKTISNISHCGPSGLLAPQGLYIDCLNAALTPLFHETDYHVESPIEHQREMLLSIALDYRNGGFIRSCAAAWADGSHAGFPDSPTGGMTLSTITEWAWKQALLIKQQGHKLCTPLFDYSGNVLDRKSERLLAHCSFQLKELNILFKYILATCSKFISSEAISEISAQQCELEIISEYHEVLLWLLNVGLLPEAPMNVKQFSAREKIQVPYPAETLIGLYKKRRLELQSTDLCGNDTLSSGSSLLFIDSLIENECGGDLLRREWKEDGPGLYPPSSLQLLLRTYLLRNVSVTQKHTLFIYMFLDLANTLEDERYASAVCNFIKFPAVFRISPAVIKTTQAFWHLDHQDYQYALEQLIDPLSRSRALPIWQHNLLLSALIAQGCASDALMVMRAAGPPIPCELQLKILIENNMVADAFELQRKWGGNQLLKIFYEGCAKHNKLEAVVRFALLPEEEKVYQDFLQSMKSKKCDDLRVIYYLQRARYVEAVSVNDELKKTSNSRNIQNNVQELQTREILVSAFQNTLPDVTRKLAEWCNKERGLLNTCTQVNRPTPLSVNIIGTSTKHLHTKATLMQTTIEKVFDTWTMPTGRGIKRGLDIEDTPFLRTPKANFERNDSNAHLVYPSAITSSRNKSQRRDEDEDIGFGTPLKRQKLDGPTPRQSITKYKNTRYSFNHLTDPYDFSQYTPHHRYGSVKIDDTEVEQNESLSLSTLSPASKIASANVSLNVSLLHTPIIKRQASRIQNLVTDEQALQPSILKVRKAMQLTSPQRSKSSSPSLDSGCTRHSNASVRSIRFADLDVINSTPNNTSFATLDPIATPHGSKISPIGATTRSALRQKSEIFQPQRACDALDKSQIGSSPSTGNDTFYSPESSFGSESKKRANTEILPNKTDQLQNKPSAAYSDNQDQLNTEVDDADIKSDEKIELSKEKSPTRRRKLSESGPQPRRSLRGTSQNTRSPIRKSKDLLNKIPPKSIERAVKQNKSLSKMVLLTNAKKREHEIDTSYSRIEKISKKYSTQMDKEIHIVTSTSKTQDDEIFSKNYLTVGTTSTINHKEDKSLKEEVVLMETESEMDVDDMSYNEEKHLQENPNNWEVYHDKTSFLDLSTIDTSSEDSLIRERRNYYKNVLRRNPIGSVGALNESKLTTSAKKVALDEREHKKIVGDVKEESLVTLRNVDEKVDRTISSNFDSSLDDSIITARRNYYTLKSEQSVKAEDVSLVDLSESQSKSICEQKDNISKLRSVFDSSSEDSIITERRSYYTSNKETATGSSETDQLPENTNENKTSTEPNINATTSEISSHKTLAETTNEDVDNMKASEFVAVRTKDNFEIENVENEQSKPKLERNLDTAEGEMNQFDNVSLQIILSNDEESSSDTEELSIGNKERDKHESEDQLEIKENEAISVNVNEYNLEADQGTSSSTVKSNDSYILLVDTSDSDSLNHCCSQDEVTKRNAAFISSDSNATVVVSDDSKLSIEETVLQEKSNIHNKAFLLEKENEGIISQDSNLGITPNTTMKEIKDNLNSAVCDIIEDHNITDDLSIEIVNPEDVLEEMKQNNAAQLPTGSSQENSHIEEDRLSTENIIGKNVDSSVISKEVYEPNTRNIDNPSVLPNKEGQTIETLQMNNSQHIQLLPQSLNKEISESKTGVVEMVGNKTPSRKAKNEKTLTPLRRSSRRSASTDQNIIENKDDDNMADTSGISGKADEVVTPVKNNKGKIVTPLRRSLRRSVSTDRSIVEDKDQENVDTQSVVSADTPRKTPRKSMSKESPSRRSARLSERSESPDAKSVASDKSGVSTRSSSKRISMRMQPTVPTIQEENIDDDKASEEINVTPKKKSARGRRSQTKSPEGEANSLLEEYSVQRRLTRHQLNMMKQSFEVSKSVNTLRSKRSRTPSVDQMEEQTDQNNSDEDQLSVISENSPGGRPRRQSFNKAQRALITPRKRRNSAAEMTDDSDVGSVKSTSSKRSNAYKFSSPFPVDGDLPSDAEDTKTSYLFSPPKELFVNNRLSVIPEENSLNESNMGNLHNVASDSKLRSRARKVSESISEASVSSKKSKASDTPRTKKLKK